MFSLLIDKLPFFAAIVNHSYFYFYISIILVTKDAVLPTGPHLFATIFHLTDMIILHILKVNRKLALILKRVLTIL